jgi:hypothetical protein
VAGLTEDAVREGMKDNFAARDFYASELKALMHCVKAKAAYALIKELDNTAARVAAARCLWKTTEGRPATVCPRCAALRS